MKRNLLMALVVGASSVGMGGCIFRSKSPAATAMPAEQPKNHGQERKEEVHERNAEKKDEKAQAKK